MPIKWTADTLETLLVAIISAGLMSASGADGQKIREAWPKNKGPAPTVSALSQHLNALRKKHCGGAAPSTSARRTAPAAPRTGGNKSKPSTTYVTQIDSDSDSEDDEENEKITPTSLPSSTPRGVKRGIARPRSPLSSRPEPASKRVRISSTSPEPGVKIETVYTDGSSSPPPYVPSTDPLDHIPMNERVKILRKQKKEAAAAQWKEFKASVASASDTSV